MIKLSLLGLAALWTIGSLVLGVPSGTLGVLSIVVILAALAVDAWRTRQVQRDVEIATNRHLASERELADITRRNRGD